MRYVLMLIVVLSSPFFLKGELLLYGKNNSNPLVAIPSGIYLPFYPASDKEKEVALPAFSIQKYPVSNAEFLEFVKKNSDWKKGKPSKLFADQNYLSHWASALVLGKKAKVNQPVTQVSWFAAKAYCESINLRLPYESEWEYVALASETQMDSRLDMQWRQKILDWYAKPSSAELAQIGQGRANFFGIYDLHGLVWEWVLDFNNAVVSSDSREGKDGDKNKFCGAGSLTATEKEDYATFMRMAFRSSLKANYSTGNLGFRCAKGGEK